jgi:hypothetical protein
MIHRKTWLQVREEKKRLLTKNIIHEPRELECGEWIPHARLVVLRFEQE